MAPCYTNLRKCIFSTDEECAQFRQLIVNIVLATDIFDKRIGALRKARWDKAFSCNDSSKSFDDQEQTTASTASNSDGSATSDASNDMMNRKATIVIEHIMQVREQK